MRTEPERRRFPKAPVRTDDHWGQRMQEPESPEDAAHDAGHHMPRRVIDGVAAETAGRRLWCLAEASLTAAGFMGELVTLLRQHGREVAFLGVEDDVSLPSCTGVADACAQHGAAIADAVLVVGDPIADVATFAPDGARVVALGCDHRPARGELALADVAALRDLFDRRTRFVSTTTYHEV
jgi:hypothetical protein